MSEDFNATVDDRTLYDKLGVTVDATSKEIKEAFRTLSKIHHPDKGGDQEEFKKISEAYNILSDKANRESYDRTGNIPKSQEALIRESLAVLRHLFSIAIDDLISKRSTGGFGGYVSTKSDMILISMNDVIKNKIKAFKTTIKNNNNVLKEMEDLPDTIIYDKEAKDNIFLQIILEKRQRIMKMIIDTKNAMEVAEYAKINLKDYVYNECNTSSDNVDKLEEGKSIKYLID